MQTSFKAMTPIRVIVIIIAACTLTACQAITATGHSGLESLARFKKAPERPNIVIVMADDLGWGDVGYNGNPFRVTPHLDALAAEGIIFDRFYAAAPVCSPTRGSLLTGRHPYRYGIFGANVGSLPESETTLAEILKGEGYATGFFGKWHLGTLSKDTLDSNRGGRSEHIGEYSPPWIHGFDTVFATEAKVPTFDPALKPTNRYQPTWWSPVKPAEESFEPYGTAYWNEDGDQVTTNLEGDDTRVLMDRVLQFIRESAKNNRPFLAVIWTHTPHLPVVASPSDASAVDSKDPYTQHYYGSILALDRQIGRLIGALGAEGLTENTLIFFTSDNGPEHDSKNPPGSTGGLRGAKRSLYEGGIRVPAFVAWPTKLNGGHRLNSPAVTSDLLPTILEVVKQSPHADHPALDGVSLWPTITGATSEARKHPIAFEYENQLALIGARYKLIASLPAARLTSNRLSPLVALQPGFELYDLREDVFEKNDLSGSNLEQVARMQKQLEEWRVSVVNDLRSKRAANE